MHSNPVDVKSSIVKLPVEVALTGLQSASTQQEERLLAVKVRQDNQRGVFAKVPLKKGQYVCEYAGDLINKEEAKQREEEYRQNDEGCYIMNVEDMAIDATRSFDRYGRYINHARKNTNVKLFRALVVNGRKRVAIMATRDISQGEELLYDYGIRDAALPWSNSDGKEQPPQKKGAVRIRRPCPVLGCAAHVLKLPQHIKTCHKDISGMHCTCMFDVRVQLQSQLFCKVHSGPNSNP